MNYVIQLNKIQLYSTQQNSLREQSLQKCALVCLSMVTFLEKNMILIFILSLRITSLCTQNLKIAFVYR